MTGPAPRRTPASAVRIDGAGLFTGEPTAVTIEPAESGGIVFLKTGVEILATIENLSTVPVHPAFAAMPPRCTSIGARGQTIHTVEHLLSALAGLGITDAVVRTDGGEIPIGDGSAAVFTKPILDVGVRTIKGASIEPIRISASIRVEAGGGSICIEPSDRPEFVYRLDYGKGSPIPPGEASWDGSAEAYAHEVAPARTFCLQAEAEAMRAAGMFEHLSPREMLVLGSTGPIDNELIFPDEPARHKLVDLIGDLSLVGRPLCARVIAERSGHALNQAAAREIVAAAGDGNP